MKSALALYASLLGVSVVLIIISLASRGEGLGVKIEFAGGIAISDITLIWCIVNWRSIWPLLAHRVAIYWFPLAAASAAVTYSLASSAMHLLTKLGGLSPMRYLDSFNAEGFGFGWAILSICIQPALFEELAFRGVIQTTLMRVLTKYEALFATALMFGVLHLSMPSLLTCFSSVSS